MKIPFTFILLALFCSSALSAFKATESVTVSGVTYSVGNNGNDCGVTRTESGTTVSWLYTTSAASGDCVGKHIFSVGSEIMVVLSVSENQQDILSVTNSATGNTNSFSVLQIVGTGVIFGKIDTSSASGTFGKFSKGFTDVGIDQVGGSTVPLTYVSAAACDDGTTFQLTVNVQSPYSMLNNPISFVSINGNGVKQVYSADDGSLKTYKAADAPFCTKVVETTTEESSGIAAWKLALIIGLPCIAILTGLTIFLYFKTAAKSKGAAKMEKFKELPTSPTVATGAENQV